MKNIIILLLITLLPVSAYCESASLSVGEMNVDGLNVKNLNCQLQEAGFMALLTVVSSLAQQKDGYKSCGLSQVPFDASWTWGGSTKAKITQIQDTSKSSCAQKLVEKTNGPAGTCSATIIGP